MTLDNIISTLKEKLFQDFSLELACYYYINETESNNNGENLTGEVDYIAFLGYKKEFAEIEALELIDKRLKNRNYKKSLNIFHFIGLALQDKLNETNKFDKFIQSIFSEHSFRYKYLITKVFNDFEEKLITELKTTGNNKEPFLQILKAIYLEESINKNQIIQKLAKEIENLDIIDFILLEDLRNIEAIGYNRIQEKLFKDIVKMAVDIQTRHKNQNNDEDQYNNLFQFALSYSGYIAHDQAQRGTTKNNKRSGELDIQILTKDNFTLSIFEAFVIKNIEKDYIKEHLIKLSENYDPNGLRYNYAVIYAKNKNFDNFWERYKKFIPKINFKYKLINDKVNDITDQFPNYAGVRIGKTEHNNRDKKVYIYHIFMDMNFE